MKLLVVRFSSIGDIVLTTPVLAALKAQLAECEVHYLTKSSFSNLLESNPHIDRIITIEKSIDEVIGELKKEHYDYIIDLHHNVRTKSLKMKLGVKMISFPKLNFKKWLLVRFKINHMPDVHVVDRYFEAVKPLGVTNQQQPIEFTISESNQVDVNKAFGLARKSFRTIAIGAQFATKKMPVELIVAIIKQTHVPIVLIGGETDREAAEEIIKKCVGQEICNAVGQFNLQESGSIINQSLGLLTNDTGMMHIASAFAIPITSVWGNTTPDLGMSPYVPSQAEQSKIHQVNGLSCRPCSKIGFSACPKGHFDCMKKQDVEKIAVDFNR